MPELVWDLLIIACYFALALSPFSLLGLFVAFHLLRNKRAPMDESNRINHIRLLWFVLTRPQMFAGTFPWLKNDELENVKDVV